MKSIKLTENQLRKLIETTIGSGDPSNVQEYQGSEVSTSVPITNQNGETIMSNPTDTDKVAKDITNSSYFSTGKRRGL